MRLVQCHFFWRAQQGRLTAASLPDLQSESSVPAEYLPPLPSLLLLLPEAEEFGFFNFMQMCVCVRRSRRRGRNVRGMGEEVSDTAASYHANYTVNVIIGNTNLAAGNYGEETDNFWGFFTPSALGSRLQWHSAPLCECQTITHF